MPLKPPDGTYVKSRSLKPDVIGKSFVLRETSDKRAPVHRYMHCTVTGWFDDKVLSCTVAETGIDVYIYIDWFLVPPHDTIQFQRSQAGTDTYMCVDSHEFNDHDIALFEKQWQYAFEEA